jgi:hypothetical protein
MLTYRKYQDGYDLLPGIAEMESGLMQLMHDTGPRPYGDGA